MLVARVGDGSYVIVGVGGLVGGMSEGVLGVEYGWLRFRNWKGVG